VDEWRFVDTTAFVEEVPWKTVNNLVRIASHNDLNQIQVPLDAQQKTLFV
jgi:hypothetical protein